MNGKAGEVYNLASGVETSIFELAKMINTFIGNQTPVDLRPARDWDRSGKRFGSVDKAREKLGFEAKVSLAEGLGRTITWTKHEQENILRTMLTHSYFVPDVLRYVETNNRGAENVR